MQLNIEIAQKGQLKRVHDREEVMEQARKDNVIVMSQQEWCGWARLIRKLRWIGLEDQALRLELAVRTLPPKEEAACRVNRSKPTMAT
jgi:hypothetical protein